MATEHLLAVGKVLSEIYALHTEGMRQLKVTMVLELKEHHAVVPVVDNSMEALAVQTVETVRKVLIQMILLQALCVKGKAPQLEHSENLLGHCIVLVVIAMQIIRLPLILQQATTTPETVEIPEHTTVCLVPMVDLVE